MVKYGVGIIEESGYMGEKMTSKSDQEPSILALKMPLRLLESEKECLLSRLSERPNRMG